MCRALLAFILLFAHSVHANVVGSDAQNFAPTQDGLDFVTVHSSETLKPGILNLGFFINYAVNTFPAYEGAGAAPAQSLLDKNDSLTGADINFAIGVFKNLQFGMSFPFVLNQTIDETNNLGRFEGQGNSEVRGGIKYHIGKKQGWGFATALSTSYNRINNNPYVGSDAGPTINFELIVDKAIQQWNWAFNTGYRWRNRGEPITSSGIDPLPNQWIASTALSYLFESIDTKLIFETYASFPTQDTDNLTNRQNSSIEALLGAKYDYDHNWAFHAGGGTELSDGTSTPDWRVYLGANYVFGSVDVPVVVKEKVVLIEVQEEKRVKITLPDVQFDFNSAKLADENSQVILDLIKRVSEATDYNMITVEGHTDSIGPAEYNQVLSENRAKTILQLLVDKAGVDTAKIEAIGYGEQYPISDNGNYQGRRENRRVEIKIDNQNIISNEEPAAESNTQPSSEEGQSDPNESSNPN